MKILMVCLGNICRSPLADGILRQKSEELGLSFKVDSAGTANYHVGEAPDHRMRATARKFGYSIDDLKARQFTKNDFDDFDLIYAMDKSNYANILSLARNEKDRHKVKILLEEYPGDFTEVPDPYYGAQKDFDEVFEILDKATDEIINKYGK